MHHAPWPLPTIPSFRLVETFKLALVQYIAFFIPIAFILSCLHGALFRYGVIAARAHHPIKQHRF